ncbi:MAG: 2'-5' RNA ligase family protein [Aeromicrobium sp.]
MVQSVELVLDERLDALVREEWDVLSTAGLPSQARHTGPSNAPHITLGVADRMDDAAELALADVDHGIGGAVRLGGLLVFQGRTAVLSRAVVPTEALLRTHRAVQAALADAPGRPVSTAPDRWTPHVTLARRLDDAQLAAALSLLAARPRELVGSVRAARRWDGDGRVTWDVGGST